MFVIKKGERIETQTSIYGGMEINRGSSSGPGRSIGVCGTVINGTYNYAGIITAGHNLAISRTDQTLYRNNSEFGKVALLMYQQNGNGDWAGVRMTSSDTLTNKIYTARPAHIPVT
ncbi:MAG: hypothetical protein LBQ15_11525 [Clostridium sp.]|nr:hypothetical protein [Clostridium sp.]